MGDSDDLYEDEVDNFSLPNFRDQKLLELALTHRSLKKEKGSDNEALEFLGDSIVGAVAAEYLIKKYPDASEGKLTRMKSALVDTQQLKQFAEILGLDKMYKVDATITSVSDRMAASVFEAVVGAYFVDCGYDYSLLRDYIVTFFNSIESQKFNARSKIDPKGDFQGWAQKHIGPFQPIYTTTSSVQLSGSSWEFEVDVYVQDTWFGKGKGLSKAEASRNAAQNALKNPLCAVYAAAYEASPISKRKKLVS